ncbi:MAG: insulinase family protein [Roseovarius sp.]|nr:insulinase family protein [Roseovarius sp.]
MIAAAALPALAEDDVTTFALDNGMQVVVIEDHRAPVVVHMVWYKTGSADETPGVSGVAHFLEHLMFKGTDKVAPGEFSSTVARNGGRDNAFTGHDYTAYYQRVAADRLELMMRMESDRMTHLRLDPDTVATERDVIVEERNQRVETSPGGLFREQMSAAQYLNHRYGLPVIGWMHEIKALDRDDALGFYHTYYAPNNAVLVVAGDVEPDEVRRPAETWYGAIPANPDLPPRVRPQEPPQIAERRLVLKDARVGQPYVSRSYLAPERDSGAQRAAAALTILAEALGGGTTSMLAERLQFEDRLAVYTGASYGGTSLDATTFDVIVAPAPGVTLDQAEAAMDEVLTEVAETGIDPDQLARIKRQVRADQIYVRDDVERLANRYGRALTQGLEVADVQAWPEVLQSVSAEEVREAAQLLLDRKQSVTGWLMAPEVTQ